jgi:uncharacterized membrane protein YdjX (TVP38/TMEM64 family)
MSMRSVTRYTFGVRRFLIAGWLALVAVAVWLAFFHRDLVQGQIRGVLGGSALVASLIYLTLGAVRGFTLIPSTYLVVAAVAFFPPLPLFGLTLIGIAISSTCIYQFSAVMRLDEVFERRHAHRVAQLRAALQRYELPIIVGWSFFPLVPTDLIVYVCGTLRVDFKKCLLGVCLGEGAICAIYIFLGDYLLRVFQLRG